MGHHPYPKNPPALRHRPERRADERTLEANMRCRDVGAPPVYRIHTLHARVSDLAISSALVARPAPLGRSEVARGRARCAFPFEW